MRSAQASDVPLLPGAGDWFDAEPAPAELVDGSDAYRDPTERLSQRVIPCWWLSGIVSLGVLVALGLLAARMFGERLPLEPDDRRSVFGVLVALAFVWSLIAPPLAWRRWRFSIDSSMLRARHGIVVHEEKAIPINRLQHVDLTRGPLERMFGLATLIVFTAGTEGATFRLPGLPHDRARELRDAVLAARGVDVL